MSGVGGRPVSNLTNHATVTVNLHSESARVSSYTIGDADPHVAVQMSPSGMSFGLFMSTAEATELRDALSTALDAIPTGVSACG
jgi:hypothetical protein